MAKFRTTEEIKRQHALEDLEQARKSLESAAKTSEKMRAAKAVRS